MKYTGNYNLKKPEGSDVVNIEDLNDNADIIDQQLKTNADNIATKETPAGAQSKADIAESNAKTYADGVGSDAVTAANAYTDQEVGVVANELTSHKNDKVAHIDYAVASGTNTYAANIQGITALVEGLSVKIKFQNANTGASTLNINGLGAKEIRKSNGNALSSGNIKAGQICHLVYTGSNFQLLGEGGEYGTAQAGDVLSGKTIGTESGLITGTMPNRGAVDNTITTQNGQIAIPQGYHNGSGIVKAQFANLVAENVKSGINIGGVVGNYAGKVAHYHYEPTIGYQSYYQVKKTLSFAPDAIIVSASPEGYSVSAAWVYLPASSLYNKSFVYQDVDSIDIRGISVTENTIECDVVSGIQGLVTFLIDFFAMSYN